MPELKFPDNFYWGAATSSHQVEGGNRNQWSEWEKENAERLVREAKKNPRKEQFPEMLNPQNYISGKAADHYNRFEEDFDLAKELNHNAHRFSIEWSRVEPREGEFDRREIEHYKKVVFALKERGIEPFVTLYHWTHPLWFGKKDGWLNNESPKCFADFAAKIAKELSDVKFWLTLNEPTLCATHSFLRGVWPPQKKGPFNFLRVISNLVRAHRLAYENLHAAIPNCQVGISENCSYFDGGLLKYPARHIFNRRFFNKIREEQDFVALQYYFHNRIKGIKINQNENKETTDMGWEVYPRGIYHVLKDLKKYEKPIYITENGLADRDDTKREKFIKDHLYWAHKAVQEGVDVRGYFHWSLLDNFEWDKGFWPRFGLIKVCDTMERRIRPSARVYARICRKNSLST